MEIEIRVVIFSLKSDHLQTLLAPSNPSDNSNFWEIPGAVLIENKPLEDTVSQCLSKYIGLHKAYLEQLYTYGDPDRGYPAHVLSIVYFSLIPADAFTMNNASHVSARWFPIDNLPALCADHEEILQYALRRLRYKLEYTAVGFELLPENFSLSELQHTYEMILGENLDKRNFRRRILDANIIEPTEQQRMGEGRPARLFRYRPDAVAEAKARRLFP